MKTLFRQKMLFSVILALSFIISGNMCFSAEQETITMLDKQVIQLEEIWKSGKTNEYFLKAREIAKKINPYSIAYNQKQDAELGDLWKAGKTNEYYAKAKEFADEIRSHSITNNLNNIVVSMFNNLMVKKADIIDSGNNDLFAMDDLSGYLFSNDKVSIKERRINVLLLCRYLGKIRKEIVPNFKRKPVMDNVSPPPGTPCAVAGMSPEAITNPVLRSQYEASIRENRENSHMNSRQAGLRSIEREISAPIIDYIIKTFRGDVAEMGGKQAVIMDNIIKTFGGDDASGGLLAECIQAANLTDKEKEEVLEKVGVKQPKQ